VIEEIASRTFCAISSSHHPEASAQGPGTVFPFALKEEERSKEDEARKEIEMSEECCVVHSENCERGIRICIPFL